MPPLPRAGEALLLPTEFLLGRAYAQDVTRNRGQLVRFAELHRLWTGITDPTTINRDGELIVSPTEEIISEATAAFDEWANRNNRGPSDHNGAARRASQWQLHQSSSVRTERFAGSERHAMPPRVEGVMLAPMRAHGMKIPGIHYQFIGALNDILLDERIMAIVDSINAADEFDTNGLPGAIFALGYLERIIAAQQIVLLQRIVPIEMLRNAASLAGRLDALAVMPPETWDDIFRGYVHPSPAQWVAGLRECELAFQMVANRFDPAVFYQWGNLRDYEGNWAATAWRVGIESVDRSFGVEVTGPSSARRQERLIRHSTQLLTALVGKNVAPVEAVMSDASPVIPEGRWGQLMIQWRTQRAVKPEARVRLRATARAGRERDRFARVAALVSPEAELLLEQPGAEFWDQKTGMIAVITGETRELRNGSKTGPTHVSEGIVVRWYVPSDDKMTASIRARSSSVRGVRNADGTETLQVSNILAYTAPGGEWRRKGTLVTDPSRLAFAFPITEWVNGERPEPPATTESGYAPPSDINGWALREQQWSVVRSRETGAYTSNLVSVRTDRTVVEQRDYVPAPDVQGEIVHSKVTRGISPLQLWLDLDAHAAVPNGKFDRQPGLVEQARLASAPHQTHETTFVRHGEAVLPAAIGDGPSAQRWGARQVGVIVREGSEAFLVGAITNPGKNFPIFWKQKLNANLQGNRVVLRPVHRKTAGGYEAPDGHSRMDRVTSKNLWNAQRASNAGVVGWVEIFPDRTESGPGQMRVPARIHVPYADWNAALDHSAPPVPEGPRRQLEVKEYLPRLRPSAARPPATPSSPTPSSAMPSSASPSPLMLAGRRSPAVPGSPRPASQPVGRELPKAPPVVGRSRPSTPPHHQPGATYSSPTQPSDEKRTQSAAPTHSPGAPGQPQALLGPSGVADPTNATGAGSTELPSQVAPSKPTRSPIERSDTGVGERSRPGGAAGAEVPPPGGFVR